MKNISQYILLGIALVIIVLFLGKCSKIIQPNPRNNTSDTVIINKHHVDTIWPDTVTVIKYRDRYLPSKTDTIYIDGKQELVNHYEEELIDTNQHIRINIVSTGKLKNTTIKYNLFIPKKIIITDTVIKTITNTTHISNKFTISVGGEVGGNKNQLSTIKPILGTSIKNTNISYGFNLIDKTHNIGLTTTIFKR